MVKDIARAKLCVGLMAVLAVACGGTSATSNHGSAETKAGAGGTSGGSGAGGSSGRGGGSGGSGVAGGSSGNAGSTHDGTTVNLSLPESEARDALTAELDASASLTTNGLFEKYPLKFEAELGYDPSTARRLDELQASALELVETELQALTTNGFVISEKHTFPTFVNGYTAIFGEHLPLYISADSILNAVHRSYDSILLGIESVSLVPRLTSLLENMRVALANGGGAVAGVGAVKDADVYLAVAASLLAGTEVQAVAGGDQAMIADLTSKATSAAGLVGMPFLGADREIDFSQFEPRGHYKGTPELERYFRAMMWLGLMDLRLIETNQDGSQTFRRNQLELAYALAGLLNEAARSDYLIIDDTIRAFVGESDNMTLAELDALLADLGITSPAELASLDDRTIAQAIIDGSYGAQQISGHILRNDTGGAIPLSSVFLLLGRRYVPDSHVFSNVVHGRVPYRMMPNPLDAAFGALANNHAARLLEPELEAHAYAPELGRARALIDAHGADFWSKNLYNLWLGSLRALSPAPDLSDPASLGLPSLMGTERWGRRILNAQLASWAELRHDTLLYAKQSYTDAPACEFPDAYVDPYPEFYAALVRFAELGETLAVGNSDLAEHYLGQEITAYFKELRETASMLKSMAEHQRTGAPFTTEQMAFVNQTVTESEGCFHDPNGWYPRLGFRGVGTASDTAFDPTIADVHTQPTDEGGAPVGRVLHVGTGHARLMIVTADNCEGPQAYVGLASSYFERVTENFERLNDEQWSAEITLTTPEDVPWMRDIVVR
jgi:hypothetical protein